LKLKIKGTIILLSFLLTGCLPLNNLQPNNDKETDEPNTIEIFKTPDIKTHEKYYQSLLINEEGKVQLSPGEARGEITGGPNNRIDIDELEIGLMRISQDFFSVEKYYYQAGQYLSKDTVRNWLGRSNGEQAKTDNIYPQKGFNPAIPDDYDNYNWEKKMAVQEDKPRILSYVLEQNYLTETNDGNPRLGGLAIGLSFNPTYYFRVEDQQGRLYDGKADIDISKLKTDAKKIGEEVVNRLRQNPDLSEIPIVVGLYMEEKRGAVVPGNYFAKAVVKKNETSVDKWESINEQYYYFPSNNANSEKREDSSKFNLFKSKVQEFYPDFLGVIGRGFYSNDQLSRLTIDIPIQFKGKAEIISFTQFLTHLVKEQYPNEVVRIYVSSSMDQPESVIISDPSSEEPIVHIYR
jgi:protein involved in sex pheromone biosynthesis